jgi:hypothetical protein
MRKKHYALLILVAVTLVASTMACSLARQTSPPPPPPDTVTPYVPLTTAPESATSPPPTEGAPVEPTTSPEESPTETAELTETPTEELPQATAEPTTPVSEGPLDFEEPRWVHAYAHKPDGGVVLTLTIKIIGGAPPFTIKHDGDFVGTTMSREYYFGFEAAGCKGIAHNITVESADGQSKKHDYWLGKDVLPWCQ